jgi:replicative DNA helicase
VRTSAKDHGLVILSAIVPDRRDLLERAVQHLVPAHFSDRVHANFFLMASRYAEVTGAVITKSAMIDVLTENGADIGTIALYAETFDQFVSTQTAESAFRWSLDQIRELAAERATGETLSQAMEILTQGVQDPKGKSLRGPLDARSHVLSRFAEIDRELSMQDAPEGDMRLERDEIVKEYAMKKKLYLEGRGGGIEFGIPSLDAKIGGLQPGELDLVIGWTGSGKTSLMINLAWNAAIKQGKNVVFATTETLRPQVRRKIVCRHSMLPLFGLDRGPQPGLNTNDVRRGLLSRELEDKLAEVVTDFSTNPNYGKVYIAQIPRRATVSTLESRLVRIGRQFHIDLVIMDYLQLLRSETRRDSIREDLSSVVKDTKQMVTTLNDGAGVCLVSPWQVNRSSRDEAVKAQQYTLSALAETAEAPNSADIVVSLLEPMDANSRVQQVKYQILKNRDGATSPSQEITVDYATSTFTEAQSIDTLDGLLDDDLGILR